MKLLVKVLVVGVALATLASSRNRQNPGATSTSECSLDSLGRAAAFDTTGKKHRSVRLPVGEASDGGETTVYYENDKPRVVVIVYGGEMGELTARYWLAGQGAYVLEREHVSYLMPLTVRSDAPVASRLPSVLYVCGETEVPQLDQEQVRGSRIALDSALARARRAR